MSFGFSTGPQLPELIWTLVVWNLPHGIYGKSMRYWAEPPVTTLSSLAFVTDLEFPAI